VLELLSFAAHHLGISSGIEIPRGDPRSEQHNFKVTAQVPEDVKPEVVNQFVSESTLDAWSGLVRYESTRDESGQTSEALIALGIEDTGLSARVAQACVNALRSRSGTQHLYLDADRAYPPIQIQPHQYNEILSQDWTSEAFTKNFAFRPTRTLYEEWHKYFIALEERIASAHIAAIREAKETKSTPPEFVDPFDEYGAAVKAVLPHLRFVGVEGSGTYRTILFDSSGLKIPFTSLSGGEREIAFLIGQIDRFGLRQGLLMIDEPELHLNPDLLRTWVAYLRDTVLDGQVWLATHSLEAVEVAGPDASFVFEKDVDDRITRRVSALAGRPTIAALSAAIGAPAFSISKLRFVLVEGNRQTRERERFYDLCGEPAVNRFIEGGGCREVLRRLAHVKELAAETGEQLRVGGIVDRDFRNMAEVTAMSAKDGVHVLSCHEVENMFLQPAALDTLIARAGTGGTGVAVVQASADRFAGLWIAQCADSRLPKLEATPKASMSELSGKDWATIQSDWSNFRAASAAHFGDLADQATWSTALDAAHAMFEERRIHDDWWMECLGKQTVGCVSRALGFANVSVFQANVVQLWRSQTIVIPGCLERLRSYVAGLSA
jgi:hypothetical protein